MTEHARRLAIVSPYPALRAGLRALLTAEGLDVVAEGGALADLAENGRLHGVDAVVVDLPAGGLDVVLEGAQQLPTLRPVVLGPVAGGERLAAALSGRPWGYVPRDASAAILAGAARAVADGLVAVEPLLVGTPAPPVVRSSDAEGDGEELTAREREVLEFVAAGLANKQIAQRLRISEHTVKFHVAAILAKLGAQSRTEAGYVAARRGLIAL
jgi:two-component system nitrate/nitrite response regulator NarL